MDLRRKPALSFCSGHFPFTFLEVNTLQMRRRLLSFSLQLSIHICFLKPGVFFGATLAFVGPSLAHSVVSTPTTLLTLPVFGCLFVFQKFSNPEQSLFEFIFDIQTVWSSLASQPDPMHQLGGLGELPRPLRQKCCTMSSQWFIGNSHRSVSIGYIFV